MLPALDERGLREHAVSNRILFALGGPFANVVAAFTGLLALGVIELGLDAGEAAVFATTGVWTSLEQIAAALPTLLAEPSQLSGIVGIVAIGGSQFGSTVAGLLTFSVLINLNLDLVAYRAWADDDRGRARKLTLGTERPAARVKVEKAQE